MCSVRATSGKRSAAPFLSFLNPPQGHRRNEAAHPSPVESGGVGGDGYGIWCVWIKFCSWLQQWDDSSDEWFFHICVSKARRGADAIRFIFRKKQTHRTGEETGGMRKQSSERQQNDWACHIVFRLDIRKIRHDKCKTALLRRSPARV